jgi:hypothetical protein
VDADRCELIAAQLRDHIAFPQRPLPIELAEYLGAKIKAWQASRLSISFEEWCRDYASDAIAPAKQINDEVYDAIQTDAAPG